MVTTCGKRAAVGAVALRAFGVFLVAAALSACGEWFGDGTDSAGKAGQTVARVNGQEITEHELEAELKASGAIGPGKREAAAREALRRMVQRAALAQRAVDLKLHRDPEVLSALRRARAGILAQAYLAHRLGQQLPVPVYDVTDFIEQHPHYFSERKHYIFDQLVVANDLITDEVLEAIKDLNSLEEVEDVFKWRKIEYSRRLNANLGNQFPRKFVRQIEALAPGEIFFIRTRDYAVISRILDSRLQPVSGKAARALAERLLLARRDAAARRKIIEDLLVNARIDFLGAFADMPLFEPDRPSKKEAAAGDSAKPKEISEQDTQ